MNARARRWLVLVLAVVAAAGTARAQAPVTAQPPSSSSSAQPGHGTAAPPPWWKDPTFKKDLSITNEQSNQIDKIFQDSKSLLREHMTNLDLLEDRLSKMIAKNMPEPQIVKQISEVESERGALNIARSVMLYHMRQILRPPQRAKFEELHQKWYDEVQLPWQEQYERQQRQQRLNPDPKVGPEAKPTPDSHKRPQQ